MGSLSTDCMGDLSIVKPSLNLDMVNETFFNSECFLMKHDGTVVDHGKLEQVLQLDDPILSGAKKPRVAVY